MGRKGFRPISRIPHGLRSLLVFLSVIPLPLLPMISLCQHEGISHVEFTGFCHADEHGHAEAHPHRAPCNHPGLREPHPVHVKSSPVDFILGSSPSDAPEIHGAALPHPFPLFPEISLTIPGRIKNREPPEKPPPLFLLHRTLLL
ncbi:MAG: hypothetical protein ACYTHM_01315 [Planctomycetota bacterium]|jgi:hypothetical protein